MQYLVEHGEALFGSHDRNRAVRIMVTMTTEAAGDYEFVERLVAAGMNCQRINCAHDGPEQWLAMIDHVRRASRKLGKPCQVAMDLPGPKLRTGALAEGLPVLKIRPLRDDTGKVLKPGRLHLTSDAFPAADSIQLPAEWLEQIEVGDILKCRDARFSKRTMRVVETHTQGISVKLDQTTYLVPEMELKLQTPARRKSSGRVIAVPPKSQTIKLHEGDLLTLTRDPDEGGPAIVDEAAKSPRAIMTPNLGLLIPVSSSSGRFSKPCRVSIFNTMPKCSAFNEPLSCKKRCFAYARQPTSP